MGRGTGMAATSTWTSQTVRERWMVCTTLSHVQEQEQTLIIIPHDTGTALVPTNFCHCVPTNFFTSLHVWRTQPKLPLGPTISQSAPAAAGGAESPPSWGVPIPTARLGCQEGFSSPTAPPCRQVPASQGTATTLHWLSCAASPRDQDSQGIQAALMGMVRNTSLPKTGLRCRALCVFPRDEQREEWRDLVKP